MKNEAETHPSYKIVWEIGDFSLRKVVVQELSEATVLALQIFWKEAPLTPFTSPREALAFESSLRALQGVGTPYNAPENPSVENSGAGVEGTRRMSATEREWRSEMAQAHHAAQTALAEDALRWKASAERAALVGRELAAYVRTTTLGDHRDPKVNERMARLVEAVESLAKGGDAL